MGTLIEALLQLTVPEDCFHKDQKGATPDEGRRALLTATERAGYLVVIFCTELALK